MREKVIDILMNYTENEPEEITGETDLQADLGLNSLDVMSIIVEFEDTFGIKIPDEDITGLMTVGDIEAYLAAKGVTA